MLSRLPDQAERENHASDHTRPDLSGRRHQSEEASFVVEGEGNNAIKINFQSEDNKREYLALEVHGSNNSAGLKKIFDDAAASPITGTIN